MTLLNIPDKHITFENDNRIEYDFDLTVLTDGDRVRFEIGDISTSWMGADDGFVSRIQFENLNRCFISRHLAREIEIKNILDEGKLFLKKQKYPKAVTCFDEVILYDKYYAEALLLKSHALFGQGHFVKALRYYKRTLKANPDLKDIEYHKLLLSHSSAERDNFPKIKRFIFTGDELFSRGDYRKALENYDKALDNPSKFKSKILYKLLNKKATALFRLNEFESSLEHFTKSLDVLENDYAYFMSGFCEYALGLNLSEGFLRPLKITAEEQLFRALILDDVKMYDDAIKCVDELLAYHLVADKVYYIALSCKISSMQSLGIDVQYEKELLDRLWEV